MDGFKTRDPDILERRYGGGCLVIFGLPFLVAGLALIFGIIEPQDDIPQYLTSLIGIPFALVGALIIFGRRGLTIDRRLKKITKWYGLVVPMKRTEYKLELFERVSLKREVRRSEKSSYTVFAVRLEARSVDTSLGETAEEPLTITEPRDFTSGRRAAEELAKFLSLPLYDSSSGATEVREADKLDESLKDHAWRTGEKTALPDAPPVMRAAITEGPEGLEIDIPPLGISKLSYLQLIPSLLFSAFVLYTFIRPFDIDFDKRPETETLIFIAFILIFFVIMPNLLTLIAIISRGRASARIIVSSDRLIVEKKGLFKLKRYELAAIEIEELILNESVAKKRASPVDKRDEREMSPGEGERKKRTPTETVLMALARAEPITARSDTLEVSFGKGLYIEEAAYIHALIMKRLTE